MSNKLFRRDFLKSGACFVGASVSSILFNDIAIGKVNRLHIRDNITFRSGVALGGWFDLVLNAQGDISFSGHFHASGADSYNTSLVVILMTPDGYAYSIKHEGRTHGTFERGSRNDDWVINKKSSLVSRHWNDQFSQARWRWSVHAGSVIQSELLNIANQLAQEIGKAGVTALISLI